MGVGQFVTWPLNGPTPDLFSRCAPVRHKKIPNAEGAGAARKSASNQKEWHGRAAGAPRAKSPGVDLWDLQFAPLRQPQLARSGGAALPRATRRSPSLSRAGHPRHKIVSGRKQQRPGRQPAKNLRSKLLGPGAVGRTACEQLDQTRLVRAKGVVELHQSSALPGNLRARQAQLDSFARAHVHGEIMTAE